MICVDELRPCRFRRWKQACHLFDLVDGRATETQALSKFIEALGLKSTWFQEHPEFPHYDLSPRMRAKAVKAGAKEVKLKDILKRGGE